MIFYRNSILLFLFFCTVDIKENYKCFISHNMPVNVTCKFCNMHAIEQLAYTCRHLYEINAIVLDVNKQKKNARSVHSIRRKKEQEMNLYFEV